MGLAKAVRDNTLEEGQELSIQLFHTEAKLGDMLKNLPIKDSYTGFQQRNPVLPDGIDKKFSHQCQELARNRDVIDEAVEMRVTLPTNIQDVYIT